MSIPFFLVASAADNASSNGLINQKIYQSVAKKAIKLKVQNVQIGCGEHVANLCCQ